MIHKNTHKKKCSVTKLTAIYNILLTLTLLTACNTSTTNKVENENNKPDGDLATNVKALHFKTSEDRAIQIFLGESVVNIQRFSVTLDTQPNYGEIKNDNNMLYTYIPDPNFYGDDSFKFTVKDEQGSSIQETATIQVTPVNDAPVLITRNFNTTKNQATELHLRATDIENDEVSFFAANTTILGATLDCNNKICTYTPPKDAIGQDSFSITSVDTNGAKVTSTVTVNITSSQVNKKAQLRSLSGDYLSHADLLAIPEVLNINTSHEIELHAIAGDKAIQLKWKMKNNALIKKIVRKQGNCSLNDNDGTFITERINNDQFIDRDAALVNGIEYCYTVFTHDAGNNLFPLATVKVIPIISVARYPFSGANWNDYILTDGTSINKLSDTTCPANDLFIEKTSCIHAGEIRQFKIPGLDSCDGISIKDALDSFNWTCSDTTFPIRTISTGLKNNKTLSDLISFDTAKWKTNFVTISGDEFAYSTTPDVWWSNSITSVTSDNIDSHQRLTSQGTIYIIDPANSVSNYAINANHIGLLIRPGSTLMGAEKDIYPSSVITLSAINDEPHRRSFIWIEGEIDALNNENGIYANKLSYGVFNNLVVSNAQENGLKIENTLNSYARNIKILNTSSISTGNDIVIKNSKKVALSHIVTSEYSNCGISITHSNHITITNNTCSILK